jgi:hypothetical protein
MKTTWTLDEALEDLRAAIAFLDKVQAATLDEKLAAGSDPWDWFEKAARRVAAARGK